MFKLCRDKKRGFRRSLVPAVGHLGLPTMLEIYFNEFNVAHVNDVIEEHVCS